MEMEEPDMGMKVKSIFAFFIAASMVGASGIMAQDFLSANDLKPAKITEITEFDGFRVFARSDKDVTVEAMDPARTAEDGEVFNARIKLNGGGAPDYRAIGFSVKEKAKIAIYLNSSSKTDSRMLKFAKADGAVLAELAAPPDDGKNAGKATFDAPAAGVYVIYSAGSGINLYQIVIE